jgi:3-methyladenine DNA glycosylase AlkD
VFIGVTVPEQRRVARRHRDASADELEVLLASEVHEHRLTALIVLTLRFKRGNDAERERIAAFYLERRERVNNWDLVDLSAPIVLADRVRDDPRGLLDPLLDSAAVWDRRIAVLATFSLIRDGEFAETLRCCEHLLADGHDLIHKACGWLLREVGKRDERVLRGFLDRHAGEMPRTMLRYSIERLPPDDRATYMAS